MLIAFAGCSTITANAQQVATFDNLALAPNSYWNGSTVKINPLDTTKTDTTFLNGDGIFPNTYYRKGYKYWKSGWAYSNLKDVITPGVLYNSYAGGGYNSDNYAIGQQNSVIRLTPGASTVPVYGVYVTNGTYAGLSMKNGDQYARKFGDTTGTHSGLPQGSYPDWFKLTIKGFKGGVLKADSVDFYLADYRFSNNNEDYIVNTWQFVNLIKLGEVDSLIFKLSSSDVGMFGMNTPAFFCIDNLTTQPVMGIATADKAILKVYPNPVSEILTIDLSDQIIDENSMLEVVDVSGRKLQQLTISSSVSHLPVSTYQSGIYFISLKTHDAIIKAKFIKE